MTDSPEVPIQLVEPGRIAATNTLYSRTYVELLLSLWCSIVDFMDDTGVGHGYFGLTTVNKKAYIVSTDGGLECKGLTRVLIIPGA